MFSPYSVPPVATNWRSKPSREVKKLLSPGMGGRSRPGVYDITSLLAKEQREVPAYDVNDCSGTTPPSNVGETPLGMKGEHIIVPYEAFVHFVENFACRRCRRRTKVLERTTIGIATRICYKCPCGMETKLDPEEVEPMEGELVDGHRWRKISTYALNVKLLLATQLIGASHEAGMVIGGMLSLSHSVFKKAWYKLEDRVGIPMRNVTDEVVNENIAAEIDGVAANKDGYKPVDVAGDGGWQTGGKRYNSLSGHTVLIGKRTNKVVAYETYAKSCIKCDIAAKSDEAPVEHECPRNYSGSSKGMESAGILKCILDLHYKFGIYIRKFVIDDDTTTKAYAKQSYKEKVEKGIMTMEEWPTSDSGKTRKRDYGQLPLTHPEIEFVADPNHRTRTFGSELWKLKAKGKTDTDMSLVDCHRIKRNFAFWLHTFCRMSRKKFEETAPAVVLHHFNNHSCCDKSWCVYISKGKDAAEKTGKYRCAKKHAKLFARLKQILQKFTTKHHLDEMHHCLTSQQCEALNRAIMRLAPKTTCFSKTKSLCTRIAIAISINSIGHSSYYKRVFKRLGLAESEHSDILFRKLDRRAETDRLRAQSAEVKRRRAFNKNAKWRKDAKTERFDESKGRTYKPGVGMEDIQTNPPPHKKRKQCRCGSQGHIRSSHKDCPFNKKNLISTTPLLQGTSTTSTGPDSDPSHTVPMVSNVATTTLDETSILDTSVIESQIQESAQWDTIDFD